MYLTILILRCGQFEHVECFVFYKCNLFGGHTIKPTAGGLGIGTIDCTIRSDTIELNTFAATVPGVVS